MLLCKMCIEKKLPPYKYNNNDFELKFCEECQCETQYLDYELFKNKLFDERWSHLFEQLKAYL